MFKYFSRFPFASPQLSFFTLGHFFSFIIYTSRLQSFKTVP